MNGFFADLFTMDEIPMLSQEQTVRRASLDANRHDPEDSGSQRLIPMEDELSMMSSE